MRTKTRAVNNFKKDLSSFSKNLMELQLAIGDARYALKHHMLISTDNLKMVEIGLAKLDTLRLQLISLSNVGSKTCKLLERNEALIQSLRSMKTTLGVDDLENGSTSGNYIKSRNHVLSLLKEELEDYPDDYEDYDDMDDMQRTFTEKLEALLISSPLDLVDAYCQFFMDIKARLDARTRKSGRKGNYANAEVDKDVEVMEGLYNLSEAYKDVLIKNSVSIEELIGVIKGVHLSQLQFDMPVIESLSMLSLSGLLGTALTIRELEGKY